MPTYESFAVCPRCGGDGKIDIHLPLVPATPELPEVPAKDITDECRLCKGMGWVLENYFEGATEIAALSTKIDAIKTMLDSTVYGMQKMSSNLDDIMVKLDV